MKFYELVTQVLALLQREGRVSYRALKIEFDLTDDHLAALKEDLIDAKRLAVDENGKVLVWAGGATVAGSQLSVASSQHLTPNTQTLDPSPTPHLIWPSGFAPNKRHWKPVGQPRASAKPSPHCLPISKVQQR